MSELREQSSPTSEILSEGLDSLTMRDKSLIKRSISKHHNNNFNAGYVPVHEQHLQKTGLRGRKTFAFWTLVGLLFILAVGNLILTMTILGVLRLGQGMQSLELISEHSAIKLFGNSDLNDVYKRDGRIEGFYDYPVDISGYNGSVVVKLAPKNGRPVTKFVMTKKNTTVRNVNVFEVKDGKGTVFSTISPHFNVANEMVNLNTKMAQTGRISSPIGKKLDIEAKNIHLKGAEGTSMESSEMLLGADQDIHILSNGSIIFAGKEGVKIDIKKIPEFIPKINQATIMQYKICVCMPQGKLFKIPVDRQDTRVYCDRINISQFNPCI